MGTQQILLIVLSVIIVGVAVAGGIGMFNQQAESSNRSAIISDMNLVAAQAMAYYRMPASMGGGGGEIVLADLKTWIGLPTNSNGNRLLTGNGYVKLTSNRRNELIITGFGNEVGNDENRAVRAKLFLNKIGSESRLKIIN